MSDNDTRKSTEGDGGQDWQTLVERFVRSVRFGVVEIVIHEGRVTQIEKTERVRVATTRLKVES